MDLHQQMKNSMNGRRLSKAHFYCFSVHLIMLMIIVQGSALFVSCEASFVGNDLSLASSTPLARQATNEIQTFDYYRKYGEDQLEEYERGYGKQDMSLNTV